MLLESNIFNPPDEDWALSNAYWIAVLSDNTVIYGDGNEPALPSDSIWFKLKHHCQQAKVRVTKLTLKFRSNEIHINIPNHVNWIYLSKGKGKEWVTDQEDNFFIIGVQSTETVLEKHWYKIPELIHHKTVASEIKDLDTDFLCFMPMSDIM